MGGRPGLRLSVARLHLGGVLYRPEAVGADARRHRGEELRRDRRNAATKAELGLPARLPGLRAGLLRVPGGAAGGGGRLRLQRLTVPRAALARLHPRLVLHRQRAEARHVTRPPPAAWPVI